MKTQIKIIIDATRNKDRQHERGFLYETEKDIANI